MIVDFHTHIFPSSVKEDIESYLLKDPGFKRIYSNPRARLATAEDLIQSMDESGVDVSVVTSFAWSSHELCMETNDYLIQSVKRYAPRLVGFCAIQPRAGAAALAELERCAQAGINGIGEMRPDDQDFDLDDPQLMGPLAEAAVSLGMPFLTHATEPVGHQYPGKGSVTPDKLYRFLLAFPALKVVLAHWGGGLPFYSLMPEVGQAMTNTYFDTAASQLLYRSEVFNTVGALVGFDKILFGSDYPLIQQNRAIAEIESLGLPGDVKESVLGGNARSLLGLPA